MPNMNMLISGRRLQTRLKTKLLQCVVGLATVLGTLSSVADTPVTRLSEPVAQDQVSETFGAVWAASRPTLKLAEVLQNIDAYANQPLIIETSIAKVCQKKGCFFIAQAGPHAIRVSFRDYGFFIPTDASGKVVELAGELVRIQRSKEQAEHFSEDAGASGAVPAGEVVELIADGIRIPFAKS